MDERDKDLLKRLVSTFEVEAREHIGALSAGLIELEKTTAADSQRDIIEAIFREVHSLKGAARAVNLAEIEEMCQALESIFAALKGQEIALSSALFDELHQAADSLGALLVAVEAGPRAVEKARIMVLLQRLEDIPKGARDQGSESRVPASSHDPEPQSPPSLPPPPTPALAETVRIATAKLDALLLQAEELVSAKLTTGQRVAELHEMNATLAVWQQEWTKMRRAVGVLQRSLARAGEQNGQTALPTGQEKIAVQLRPLLEFLQRNDGYIRALDSALTTVVRAAEQDHRALGRMVDDLLEDMKKLSMLPFSSLLEIVPKLARDLARDRDKEVEVVIRGGDIEIDRRILEEMKDPLIHVVRNCIDHGIEAPQERLRKRKPRRGTVTIVIAQKHGSQVELLIADDGAGVDVARVKSAAQKLGVITPEEAEKLDEQQALGLIFHSGVSTSPTITALSGRGLGLAIVREKVEKLGGAVSFETSPDVGATFRLLLPPTLATFRGVLVRAADRLFVLPTTYVERVLRVNKADIKTVANREMLSLHGQAVSLVRLADALELSRKNAADAPVDRVPAVVLATAAKRIAFTVEAVLAEQEVLVKRLGPQLPRVRNIAGATILGTGQVVPVLNVPDVLKSAVRTSEAAVSPGVMAVEREEPRRKCVLLVEDSITTRMLLENLLEAAGYQVRTAVDGVDALAQLRSNAVDIVVSDVDMPRMNGFDLTTRIRSDKQFADVPVVLVTALESDADRERGIQVGANAYLVKSRFEQGNLLTVIQRFV